MLLNPNPKSKFNYLLYYYLNQIVMKFNFFSQILIILFIVSDYKKKIRKNNNYILLILIIIIINDILSQKSKHIWELSVVGLLNLYAHFCVFFIYMSLLKYSCILLFLSVPGKSNWFDIFKTYLITETYTIIQENFFFIKYHIIRPNFIENWWR